MIKYLIYFLICLVIVISIAAVILPHVLPTSIFHNDRFAETKASIHTLQIALERYAEQNNGEYPADFNSLFYQDIITSTPYKASSDIPMRNIPFGTLPCAWEFTYVPVIENCDVIGYYLLGYGAGQEDWTGYDVNCDGAGDNVIIVLTDVNRDEWHRSNPDPVLAELLSFTSNLEIE